MLLMSLSAGAIIHSTQLTKFMVTGFYQVYPGILKEIHQHTTIIMDGNGVGVLGGGVWRQLKIAAATLGGGGDRRTCNDGFGIDVGVDVVKCRGLTITVLASALARTASEDASDARDVHLQQWQGDRHILAAVAAVRMQRWCRQGKGKGTIAWCQTGPGKGRVMQQ
jgi:hypothetical protein